MISYGWLEDVAVTDGLVDADGWATQHVVLEFRAKKLGSGIKVALFNPDVSPKFISTRVKCVLNGTVEGSVRMNMGTRGEINLNAIPYVDKPNELSIDVSTFLEPDQLDPRERATILLGIDLIGIKAGIVNTVRGHK